jgi:hypothetical protein
MARQTLQEGPYLDAPIASPVVALAATTIELMWNPLQFTKFYGDEARASRVYRVQAGGILTTNTTGALTISPSITTTNGTGTTLGVSGAQTVPGTALTAVAWWLDSAWVVRTIGAPAGSNATMIGEGFFHTMGVVGTAGAGPLTVTFGGTSAIFDQSISNAICMAKTLTVAGSLTTHWCLGYWMN